MGYKIWNYIQQGGVAEIVAPSLPDLWMNWIEKGMDSWPALNIHDSVILCCKIEEYPQAPVDVIEMLGTQVPESLLNRTNPPMRFLSEVGPENAFKWGWQNDQEYPFPLDEFVNRWGVHKLDETELAKEPKDREAPTWRGPYHQGYTLEAEIEEVRAKRKAKGLDEEKETIISIAPIERWHDFKKIVDQLHVINTDLSKVDQRFLSMQVPREIIFGDKTLGPFDFPSAMVVGQELAHKGHDHDFYFNALKEVTDLEQFFTRMESLSTAYREWRRKYNVVPTEPRRIAAAGD
jgi:hypothetical protein